MIPGVLPYSLSYACLKMVNYAFFFWLPTYLTQGVHWSDKKADELSNFYDIGGITGRSRIYYYHNFYDIGGLLVGLVFIIITTSMI